MEEKSKKILEFQILQRGLETLESREREIVKLLEELEISKISLEEIEKIMGKGEVMFSVGGGNYVKGNLSGVSEVYVNIGAGVVMKKPLSDAKKIIEERIENIRNSLERIEEEKVKIAAAMQKLRGEIENEPGVS